MAAKFDGVARELDDANGISPSLKAVIADLRARGGSRNNAMADQLSSESGRTLLNEQEELKKKTMAEKYQRQLWEKDNFGFVNSKGQMNSSDSTWNLLHMLPFGMAAGAAFGVGGGAAGEAAGVGGAAGGELAGLIPAEFGAAAEAAYGVADAGLAGLTSGSFSTAAEVGLTNTLAAGGDMGWLSTIGDFFGVPTEAISVAEGAADSGLGSFFDAAGAAYDDALLNGFGDLTFSDPIGSIISNGASFGADAAGEGFTYDMFGDIIPNADAASTYATQVADATAANLSNGLTATGGLSPTQYAEMAEALKGGFSLEDAVKKALKQLATPDNVKSVIGALSTGAGTLMQSNAAKSNAAALAAASKEAAGILSPAITQAAGHQANAATGAANTLASAATAAGTQISDAYTQSGKGVSQAATDAAGVLSNANVSAANTSAAGALGAGNTLSGAYLGAGKTLADTQLASGKTLQDATNWAGTALMTGITGAGKTMSDAYTGASAAQIAGLEKGGQLLSGASLEAAKAQSDAALRAGQTLSTGYKDAAGQQVAGYREGIGTAERILAEQKANQQPYMAAGTTALKQLQEGLAPGGAYNRPFTMADAQNTDAYKFALNEGKTAINNASAAGGLQLSSANIESLGKFAEGTAAQYQQQAFSQWMAQNNLTIGGLQGLINSGQVSTAAVQSALAQAGISIETLQSNIGQAQAAGTLGSANSLATADQQAAGFTAGGIRDSASALAAVATGSGAVKANGVLGAGQATSQAQRDAAAAQATYGLNSVTAMTDAQKAAAAAQATAGVNSGTALSQAQKDAAAAVAAGQVASGTATAGGILTGANALASGNLNAAITSGNATQAAANAQAAGQVSSAGYTAGGTTGAANVTANGITGSANSIAAGAVSAANSNAAGVSAIGNQIAKSGIFANIPTAPQYTLAGV